VEVEENMEGRKGGGGKIEKGWHIPQVHLLVNKARRIPFLVVNRMRPRDVMVRGG